MLSLIELCCKVLAQNFTAIESLEYIPEHLGRLICAYISQDLLNDRVLSLRLFLNLFSQAYGGSFLSSFRLRQCPDFTRWIEAISICITLTALNVDSCGLGGEFHELLPWLGRLEGVKFLSIRWNNLTNDGIRSLTANWRGSGRSNCKLAVVDVSGNPFLGEVSLRLLTGIVSLQMLYLSDTGLAVCRILRELMLDFHSHL